MRVAVVAPGPQFSVMDVYDGWVDGLRNAGCLVRPFNLHDRLNLWTSAQLKRDGEYRQIFDLDAALEITLEGFRGQVYDFWPDVILFVSGFFCSHSMMDFMRSRGHRIGVIHTESPYEDDRQLALAEHADFSILNDPTNIDAFAEIHDGRAWYFPHAYRPERHHDQGRTDEYDFGFIGTGYPSRVAYLSAVDWSGINAALGGNWPDLDDDSPLRPMLLHEPEECVDNEETSNLYRASITTANLYRREGNRPGLTEGWAMGPREVEAVMCGTFLIRDRRPESDEVLPMLPATTSPQELGDLVRWAVANPDACREATAKAQVAVADRTFEASARRLLTLLD